MQIVNLTIAIKSLGGRTASVVLLESNGYRKAFAKVAPDNDFKKTFSDAIQKLKTQVIVNVFTNKKSKEVGDLIMRENSKGEHFIFLQSSPNTEKLEMLGWSAYEIALQNGTDEAIMADVLRV